MSDLIKFIYSIVHVPFFFLQTAALGLLFQFYVKYLESRLQNAEREMVLLSICQTRQIETS